MLRIRPNHRFVGLCGAISSANSLPNEPTPPAYSPRKNLSILGMEHLLGNICSKSANTGRLLSTSPKSGGRLSFDLVRSEMFAWNFAMPTASNACDQSLPCNNTSTVCHKESSINSQLISPVDAIPLPRWNSPDNMRLYWENKCESQGCNAHVILPGTTHIQMLTAEATRRTAGWMCAFSTSTNRINRCVRRKSWRHFPPRRMYRIMTFG